jgi:hypothetical protein
MNCLSCNKETINPKFCSKSCAAKYNNRVSPKRKTKKLCIVCNSSVKSYRHSRCEKHHQEYMETRFDFIKELSLKDYWNKKSLQKLHISSKNAHIRLLARSNFKDLVNKSCASCGYNKHVELCHIKALSSFNENSKIKEINSYTNLIQLCPNCHWEFDKGLIDLCTIQDSNLGLQT